VKRALSATGILVVALGGITALALESGGVAVVETRGDAGATRATHVWYAEDDGELWLEAGTRQNGWFQDVLVDPRLELDAPGLAGAYRARPVENPVAHGRIRSLIRAKYGWRDWWVAFLLVDSSESVAVRLVPIDAG
jgi:hypothetical protein